MAIIPHRPLKAVLGLMISRSVRNKLCFVVILLAALAAINTNAADVTYTPSIPIEPKEAVYPVNSVARGPSLLLWL